MFNINDVEIAVITFNRKPFLEKTLSKLLAADSPVKTCMINVYNNNSTDGTTELLNEYAQKYQNLTHIKNKRNVGLSGNICKAMENASQKYIWVVCDNDEIDWTHWPSVQKGLEEDNDIVLVSRFYIKNAKTANVGLKIAQLTFLPSGIYKTSYLTDFVTSWMYNDAFNVLPHIVLACAIINEKGSIYIPDGSVVLMEPNPELVKMKEGEQDISVLARVSKKRHPKASAYAFETCEINSCSLLDNKKYVRQLIEVLSDKNKLNGYGPYYSLHRAIRWYILGKTSYANLMDIYHILPYSQKFRFWVYFTYASIRRKGCRHWWQRPKK